MHDEVPAPDNTAVGLRLVGPEAPRWQRPYYLAAVANTGGPVLGVVDSTTNRWIGNWPTGSHAHSVAADPLNGKVFVPIAAGSAIDCVDGCIAVFGPCGE